MGFKPQQSWEQPLYQCSRLVLFQSVVTYFPPFVAAYLLCILYLLTECSKIRRRDTLRFYSPWVFSTPHKGGLLICRILLLFFSYFNFPPLLLCILNNNECFLSSCPLPTLIPNKKGKFSNQFHFILNSKCAQLYTDFQWLSFLENVGSKKNNDFKLVLAETLQKGFSTVVLIGFCLCKLKSYINIAT